MFACCRETKKAYGLIGLPNLQVMGNSVMDWFFGCLDALHDDLIPKFVIICWGIWCSRNSCLWHGTCFYLNLLMRHALLFLKNWTAANDTPSATHGSGNVVKCEKPQRGRLKLNIDATIDQTKGITGFGLVFRDHNGQFLAAKNLCVYGT